MKVEILTRFRDKNDYSRVYEKGEVAEFDVKRARELNEVGLVAMAEPTTTPYAPTTTTQEPTTTPQPVVETTTPMPTTTTPKPTTTTTEKPKARVKGTTTQAPMEETTTTEKPSVEK